MPPGHLGAPARSLQPLGHRLFGNAQFFRGLILIEPRPYERGRLAALDGALIEHVSNEREGGGDIACLRGTAALIELGVDLSHAGGIFQRRGGHVARAFLVCLVSGADTNADGPVAIGKQGHDDLTHRGGGIDNGANILHTKDVKLADALEGG